MSVFYLDSSAWLKRYFLEPGSGWVADLFAKEEHLASSVLGYIEVASALVRQKDSRKFDELKLAKLQRDLEEDWDYLTGLQLTDEDASRAVGLAKQYGLRGADTVHLATALKLKDFFLRK